MPYAQARPVTAEEIPIIDVGPLMAEQPGALESTAEAIMGASQGLGFYYIRNHAVTTEIREQAFAASRAFFLGSVEAKRAIATNDINRGWMGIGEALMTGATRTDLKELFSWGLELGPDDPEVQAGTPFRGPNQWPQSSPTMRSAIYDGFYAAGCRTGAALLRAVCVGLGLKPDALAPCFEKPMARGQLIYYPPQPADMGEEQFGVSAHTDFGCLTMVCQDDLGGLQVQSRDGEWLAIPPVEGTLLVNVGDLLARWSNGRFASTLHRVVNSSGKERFSMAVFYDPAYHTVIDPRDLGLPPGDEPRFEATVAGEHQLARFNQVFAHDLKGIDKAAAAHAPTS
ncbi:MAG: isopenicillin N synthase family oxygenase [Rhodospirillaceae bacterium]|jgi:isopenicillin N synthase-like dioxygenase|nr:isopenicillin N synthase family oxygenase [Rhodospirillaceae bacterium]MBT6510633.1 isopenicillin N synthase family oxygenase [Rhodospirillaceae bacterium]